MKFVYINIIQVVLAKHYIDVLGIAKDSADGKKLLNYRAPNHAKHVSNWFRQNENKRAIS